MSSSPDFGTLSDLPVNVNIPGYRLRRQVGADAVGLWFDAEQESLERELTLKVLKPEYEQHAGARNDFLAEMDRLAPIDHPNLARVIDTIREGTLVLVTERVGVDSLARLLQPEKPVGVDLSLYYVRCVARALHHLLGLGLAHKNVTPRLISLYEERGCRLVTFRNVLALEDLAKLKGRLTQDPNYVAPEQLAGEEEVGSTTHSYHVGALLFHLLAGVPPHGKGTGQEVAKRHLTQDFPHLKRLQPFLKPRGLYDFIAACTSRSPDERPDLARLLDALDDLMEGRDPGLDGQGGSRPVVAPRSRRRRRRR
ncbi:MAG: serine/threonine protein kinase [Planctomycetota bacterium]